VCPRDGVPLDLEQRSDAVRLLDDERAVLRLSRIPVVTEIRSAPVSRVADEIVAAAKDCSADAIVVGSRGRSDLAALFRSSTDHKVLHKADCPVVVVR